MWQKIEQLLFPNLFWSYKHVSKNDDGLNQLSASIFCKDLDGSILGFVGHIWSL